MANVTRKIGLSLGADICWPICFEEILRRLKLDIPIDGEVARWAGATHVLERAPVMGEHTFEVARARLGLSGAEIAELMAAGVLE